MMHMETTIKEEKSVPGYPDEDRDVRTTDRVQSSTDESLTCLNWLRKYSVPDRSPLVGDTAVTRMPLQHHPLAVEPAASTMPLHPENLADASVRPPHSYASLIYRAIRDDKHSRMTLSNIYRWMKDNFPYYRNSKSTTWQNSVRHTLSVNKCFVKVCKEQDESGKGGYWQISPESERMFVGGVYKSGGGDASPGGFLAHAQKRKLLPQDYDSTVVQEHKTVVLNNVAVQGQRPNTAVQGPNTAVQGPNVAVQRPNTAVQGPNVAVQGPNVAVQGPNVAVQGPKLRKLLPQQQPCNTVPQSHNIMLQQGGHNNSAWRGGHDIMAQQGHNFVVQAGHTPGVQICTPSVQICFQICIPSMPIFTQQVSK